MLYPGHYRPTQCPGEFMTLFWMIGWMNEWIVRYDLQKMKHRRRPLTSIAQNICLSDIHIGPHRLIKNMWQLFFSEFHSSYGFYRVKKIQKSNKNSEVGGWVSQAPTRKGSGQSNFSGMFAPLNTSETQKSTWYFLEIVYFIVILTSFVCGCLHNRVCWWCGSHTGQQVVLPAAAELRLWPATVRLVVVQLTC